MRRPPVPDKSMFEVPTVWPEAVVMYLNKTCPVAVPFGEVIQVIGAANGAVSEFTSTLMRAPDSVLDGFCQEQAEYLARPPVFVQTASS